MSVSEAELKAVAVAPRVTKEDVDSFIAKEEYLQHGTLTFCILTGQKVFTYTGESACASLANFNAAIGQRLAKEHAVNKIWGHLGFELKTKLTMIENAGKPQGKILTLGSPVTYLGTKVIHAVAMTRAEYNAYRGWPLPSDEDGDDNGYLIENADDDRPNVTDHVGYVSWLPRDVFEKSYSVGIRNV